MGLFTLYSKITMVNFIKVNPVRSHWGMARLAVGIAEFGIEGRTKMSV